MARDVTGASRANLLEIQTAADGTRYTPVHRISGAVTYRGSDGSTLTVSDHRRSGDELQQAAAMQREYPHLYGRRS